MSDESNWSWWDNLIGEDSMISRTLFLMGQIPCTDWRGFTPEMAAKSATFEKKLVEQFDQVVTLVKEKYDDPEGMSLRKTRMALWNYDEAETRFHKAMECDEDAPTLLRLADVAEGFAAQVGAAFAEETKDRNNPDCAAFVRSGPWLRTLVKKYGGPPK